MVHNSTLTSIEFTKAKLSGVGLTRISTGCPYLKKLLLACGNGRDVTDEAVRSLAKCPKLERLSLLHWTKITDASIITLISLSMLKEINLSRCSGLTSGGVQSLLKSNRNLRVIILSSYMYYRSCKFCDYSLLNCIGECCPNLREFAVKIDPESMVLEAFLITLFKGCPLLEKLTLGTRFVL